VHPEFANCELCNFQFFDTSLIRHTTAGLCGEGTESTAAPGWAILSIQLFFNCSSPDLTTK
jgi:hypothetical protein